MKKIVIYMLAAVAAMSVFSACHDYKDDYMVADSVYLRSEDGNLQEYSIFDPANKFGVIKAGKGFSSAWVTLEVSNVDLVEYNMANGTDYVPLDRVFYNYDELNGKVVKFAASDARTQVEVTWDTNLMKALLSSSTDDYVIPIVAKESNLEINKDKQLLLIHPFLSTLTRKAENSGQVNAPAGVESTVYGKVGVNLDRAVPTHDVKVKVSLDNSKAAGYVFNGFTYTQAPEGAIKLASEELTIPAGDIEADIRLTVDMSKVADDVTYVAGAVTIDSAYIVDKDGNNVPVPVGDDTIYVLFNKVTAK